MHRTRGSRRLAARIIGWGIVAVAYTVVLVWAGGLIADPAAAEATSAEVAGILAAAPAEDATLAAAQVPAMAAEEPVVTLVIAGAMVALAALAYLVHLARDRRLRRGPAATARLVVRHITTLQ